MRWLNGHTKDVRAVAYLPDGRLVSGGGDRAVRVWDPASGECVATIKAVTRKPVYAVAVSPDGQTLAYAGLYAAGAESNFVHLCDPAGKPLGRHEIRTEGLVFAQTPGLPPGTFRFDYVERPVPQSIWSVAFSADGKYLAAATRQPGGANIPNGGGAWCWALGSGSGPPRVALAEYAYTLAFAPAGRRLAVTRRGAVQFHDDPAAPPTVEYPTTAEWSAAVAFVPGADLAVIGCNSYLYFVNPARHEKPQRVKTGVRVVSALAASPDGKTLVAGGRPGTVEVYDVANRTRTTTYDFGVGGLHAVAFAPDGLTFAAAGDRGLVVGDAAD